MKKFGYSLLIILAMIIMSCDKCDPAKEKCDIDCIADGYDEGHVTKDGICKCKATIAPLKDGDKIRELKLR